MLRQALKMRGFHVVGKDDKVGKIHDFYFDDQSWTVRYVIVDTGSWLDDRKVMLSPAAIAEIDWSREQVLSPLTREQIEDSPDIALDQPVSRQHEVMLHDHYAWPYYWGAPAGRAGMTPGTGPIGAAAPIPPATTSVRTAAESAPEAVKEAMHEKGDPHLRSMKEVRGYGIHATDGGIGEVDDFFFDEAEWRVRYLLVDTGVWIFGKEVLISPDWIDNVSWADLRVNVDVSREQVENSPEYNPQQTIGRDSETMLYTHYGFPGYWV
ncbi:MAG: PRC-barrel domain-containing protein [Caldilineaceae bacterium]|nr:PRC-barrel domain-containing protein [Caldilineaceae bacterium]